MSYIWGPKKTTCIEFGTPAVGIRAGPNGLISTHFRKNALFVDEDKWRACLSHKAAANPACGIVHLLYDFKKIMSHRITGSSVSECKFGLERNNVKEDSRIKIRILLCFTNFRAQTCLHLAEQARKPKAMPASSKQALVTFIGQQVPASQEALATIAAAFEEIQFAEDDYFLKEGRLGGYLFLAEGFMRAFTFDPEGNEVTTYFYPKNRVVFDVSGFFLRKPSTENIQAVTDCHGYLLTIEKLNVLFHSIPEFREFGRLMLIKEFIAYKDRTLAMIKQSAEQRYAELVSTNPEIFQHAQLKQIASYLGISERSLSRIRNEFAKK